MTGILSTRPGVPNPLDAPYVHKPFPSVRHHRSGKTQLVNDEAESAALLEDPEWKESPADFAPDAQPTAAAAAKTPKAEKAPK